MEILHGVCIRNVELRAKFVDRVHESMCINFYASDERLFHILTKPIDSNELGGRFQFFMIFFHVGRENSVGHTADFLQSN